MFVILLHVICSNIMEYIICDWSNEESLYFDNGLVEIIAFKVTALGRKITHFLFFPVTEINALAIIFNTSDC